MPTSDLPSLRSLWPLIATEASTFNFLLCENIISVPQSCEACGGNVTSHGIQARCTKRYCRKWVSCVRNSFFARSKIPLSDALLLGYVWLTGATNTIALSMTTHNPNTISQYFGFFRQLVADALNEEDWTIGGDGIIVEVDESKFGKRKHNRGHHIEGAWVIGGIERTAEKSTLSVSLKKGTKAQFLMCCQNIFYQELLYIRIAGRDIAGSMKN